MEDLSEDEKWLICGDFNMVDLPDDLKGKNTFIHGGEE